MPKPFTLHNTLTRTKEAFNLADGQSAVRIYTCGPTVYNFPHIGNLRTYIFEDVLVRTLKALDYSVNRVMNITDVGHLTDDGDDGDDKMQLGAEREGITAWDIAKKYEAAFLEDMKALHLEIPETLVRATDTIQEQIEFIQALEEKGLTYQTEDGIYFESTKFPEYGKMAGLNLEGQQNGIRVQQGTKHHGSDFALWKFSTEAGKRHMEWESPWGTGFPGWHIECSAIIRKSLGDTIDIHCGGVDHIAIHHTNEIAQSESLTGQSLARFWSHSEFLLVDGGKMSKSLNNFYTLADLVNKGYDPLALRLFSYSALYRSKLNFTWEGLDSAQQSLDKLRTTYRNGAASHLDETTQGYYDRFLLALADDLNTPVALSLVWEVVHSHHLNPDQVSSFLLAADDILQLDLDKALETIQIPEEIQILATHREAARSSHDWSESDRLRAEIESKGFSVQDTPSGQLISK